MKVKPRKGISLIVLVITIIVMIILAGAIILTLNSTGVIGKANEAKKASDIATANDIVTMALSDWELNEEALSDEYGSFAAYAESKLAEAGFKNITDLEEAEAKTGAYELTDDGEVYIYPKIPTGFVASIYEGETNLSEGLVIYQASTLAGIAQETAMTTINQYVWVPVVGSFERKAYQGEDIKIKYSEPISTVTLKIDDISKYDSEVKLYNDMKESVAKYGGFYVARYEAGTPTGSDLTGGTTTGLDIDGTDSPVSRKGVGVWKGIRFDATYKGDGTDERYYGDHNNPGAALVAMNAYKAKDVTSHLIFGVQWDSMLNFIEDEEHDLLNSTEWGNYQDSMYEAAVDKGDKEVTGTNEYRKAKNIYDVAGNYFEWTYELGVKESYSVGCRTARGGSCHYSGVDDYPACARTNTGLTINVFYTFRVVLCMK